MGRLVQSVMVILQLLLLLVVASHASSNSTVLCRQYERDALLAFKTGFNVSSSSSPYCPGGEYARTETWNGSDCCKWDGVKCDSQTGHVVTIDLYCSLLTGSFPPNATLFLLPNLRSLSLYGNFLSGLEGEFPIANAGSSMMARLTDIDLSYNMFVGIIPGWIFTLPFILELRLYGNQFTSIGQFETRNDSLLTVFDADYNWLQGEIPDRIFELPNLQHLYLRDNNLTGTIPLSRFHKLQGLDLSDNRLSIIDDMVLDSKPSWPSLEYLSLSSCNLPQFPSFLRQQVNLTLLELSNNGIHGAVPKWLLELGNLQYLNLSHNSLSSGLENLPWKSMYTLDIQYNSFQGVVPVPSHNTGLYYASNNHFTGNIPHLLCNMSELALLDLSQNNITGEIPNCFPSLIMQNIQVLNLRQNQLQGSVSSSLFQDCPSLGYLDLSGNKLEGPIPQSITNCSQLNFLDLSYNNFNGTFPHYLDSLPMLVVLNLASNKLNGPLKGSNTSSSFLNLHILDVSNNDFIGSLPCDLLKSMKLNVIEDNTHSISYMGFPSYHDSIKSYFKGTSLRIDLIPTVLAYIDASMNRLEGPIPDAIGNLTALRWLNLTHNNFTGHIPPSLSKLTLLESLDLSFNRIEGSIPNELVNLNSLEVFNVSENELTGPVPTGKQFDTFSDSSYLGNPLLCGPLLTNKCGNPNNTPPNPTIEGSNKESSVFQLWDIVLAGCVFGILMGIAWGYLLFWIYSPYWVSRLIFQIETLVILHQRKRRQNRRR